MPDPASDLTPKWSSPNRPPRRAMGRPVIVAIVLAVIAAIAAVVFATKYRRAQTGHEKPPAVLLKDRK